MLRKPTLIVMIALALVAALAYAAGAATGVTKPAPLTFKVPGDGSGVPQSVTVTASGYTPGSLVYIEQCDGVDPTSSSWNVTIDCDLGSSPAPVIVDGTGTATFPANDPNFGFTAFKGGSPQDEFNCLAANQPSPANGLPDFRNCQIRLATSNTVVTADQVFFTLVLPDAPDSLAAAGHCSLGTQLAAVKTATSGQGMTDQTQDVTISAKLLNDVHTGTPVALGGTCSGLVDSHYAGTGLAANAPRAASGTLHETAAALKLVGSASCAWTAPGIAADAAASGGYTMNGALKITFSELGAGGKPLTLAAEVMVRHNLVTRDLYDFKGVVTKGLSVGANITGTEYLDPVAKFGGTATSITSNAGPVPSVLPAGYTGYGLDTVGGNPSGCDDGVANNTSSPANVVPAARTDVATVTSGSAQVSDSSIQAGDVHKPVAGTGVPAGSFVGSVTPGVGFRLSSSSSSQVDVNATKSGTSVKITNPVAFNIKAQTGILTYQLGDGLSPLGNAASGLTLSF